MTSLLIKFGAEDHMKQMQKEGLLYCKSVLEFANMKNDSARGDEGENVNDLELLPDKEIWLKPSNDENARWKKLDVTYSQKRISDISYKGNLFCMSGFTVNEATNTIPINKRFKEEFGEYYLLILDQPEFFSRIHNLFSKSKISYERKLVEYLDLKYFTGNKSIFVKDNYFSWQNEYRILIKTGVTELQTFKIGNIEDITELGRLNNDTSFIIKKKE